MQNRGTDGVESSHLTADEAGSWLDSLTYGPDGLICAVAQDATTREVLMVAWMDREALRRTIAEGRVTYFSRSRQEYWRKGDTSGHVQYLRSLSVDCDADTLLVQVDQVGAACHTGTRSCFTGREVVSHPAMEARP